MLACRASITPRSDIRGKDARSVFTTTIIINSLDEFGVAGVVSFLGRHPTSMNLLTLANVSDTNSLLATLLSYRQRTPFPRLDL